MRQIKKYLYLCLSIFFIYILFHGLKLDQYIRPIQIIMFASIAALSLFFAVDYKDYHTINFNMLNYIILCGFILRIGYMLYTPCNVRPQDLGDIKPDGYGHAAYILKLILSKHLPLTNDIQFYHPPLFHFLGAVASTLVHEILGSNNYFDLVDAAKIVSCFASCATLLVCRHFCDDLKLRPAIQSLILTILSFFPSFFLLAGKVNNDSLATFFMFTAILYTYRWYQKASIRNTIGLALAFGFGMMTKISCITIALFTALVMCLVLYKALKQHQAMPLLAKLFLFGLISLPLGLWYPIRNYLLFDQPLNYVLEIPRDSEIFCGDIPFFQRFLSIDLFNLWSTPFADAWSDHNIPAYILKTSIFGEFSYNVPRFVPVILLFLNILLVFYSLFAFVKLMTSKKIAVELRVGLPLLWGIIIILYNYFNVRYPFGCTMDFRYIVPTTFLGSLAIGLTYDFPLKRSLGQSQVLVYCDRLCKIALPYLIMLFAFFSTLMFVLIQQ